MSDHEEVIQAITARDIGALEALAQMLDVFPTGKDDLLHQH